MYTCVFHHTLIKSEQPIRIRNCTSKTYVDDVLTLVLGTEIDYFTLKGGGSGRVVQASSESSVVLWDQNNGDNQLWYWDPNDSQILRNKAFPDKVRI